MTGHPVRQRLPWRRPTVTTTMLYGNSTWSVSIGFDPVSGQVKEVFVDGTKGELEGIIDDACVLVSRLLQYGETPEEIARHFGGDDKEPASVLGLVSRVIVDICGKLRSSSVKPNSIQRYSPQAIDVS